jgi:hypothetical protein
MHEAIADAERVAIVTPEPSDTPDRPHLSTAYYHDGRHVGGSWGSWARLDRAVASLESRGYVVVVEPVRSAAPSAAPPLPRPVDPPRSVPPRRPLRSPAQPPAAPAQSVADERTAEGLLCHHGGDEQGHRLAEDCPLQLAAVRTSVGYPAIPHTIGEGSTFHPKRAGALVDVCPECLATVKLTDRELHTADNGTHSLLPGVRVGRSVELTAHRRRVPGVRASQPCPGGGRPAPSTRYRFPEVEAMVRDFGPDSIR